MKNLFKDLIYIFVIPLVMGYYFYYLSIKERRPTFYIEPIRTVIIDDSNVAKAPITVNRRDGQSIKQSVISTTFYLFNQGSETIKEANVYSPIRVLLLDSASKILDFKVLKLERNVSGILAKLDSTKNFIDISFKVLEQHDGLVGQIIYDGQLDTKLIIQGGIEGVRSFENQISRDYLHPSIVLLLSILILCGIYFYRKWRLKIEEFGSFVVALIALILLYVAILIRDPDLFVYRSIPESLDVGQTEQMVYEFHPPGIN